MATKVEPSRIGHERRITALDGLRGLAALAVVFNHALIASSKTLADPYLSPKVHPATGTVAWWIADTPLHLFWAGQEAVVIFFVLSGYVLAVPAVRLGTRWFDRSYYPRRFLRLYLPVWGALVGAAALHLAVSRRFVVGATWWLDAHPATLSAKGGLTTASLVQLHGSEQFIWVLWSLKWEIIFSALLPLLLLVPIMTRSRPLVGVAGMGLCLAIIAYGAQHKNGSALFLPVFVLGCFLAFHMHRVRLTISGWSGAALVLGVSVISVWLLTMGYWSQNRGATTATAIPELGVVLGASLLLWLAVNSRTAARMLDSTPVQWLGSRSFSLYLIHEPVVVTVAYAMGGKPPVAALLLMGVPLSLVAAELLWRVVEYPAIRCARTVGTKVSELGRQSSRRAPRNDADVSHLAA